MALTYTIRFEKHGELRRKDGVPENEVWLDVGNGLEPGCIDHHHAPGHDSTLDALTAHPEYLRAVKQRADCGEEIVVHLHESPDLDCVASFRAFLYYMEHGEEAFLARFGPDGEERAFVTYINDIDAGRRKVTDKPTMYGIFCELEEWKEENPEQRNRLVLEKGLRLIDCALEAQQRTNGDLAEMDLTECLPKEFDGVILTLCACSFEEEKNTGNVRYETIALWKKTENGMVTEDVKAAVWKHEPLFSNAYDYARKEGALLTVVPWKIRGQDGAEFTQAVISIDPDKDRQHEYTLRPLAEMIEQMEQVEEELLYEQTGSYRRDHSEPRAKGGLLGEMPFAATSDPWYIKPAEDLIASPRAHSLLYYKDILKMIRNNASAVRQAYTAGVNGDAVRSLYENRKIPLSVWEEENQAILKRADTHAVIWAEMDASMIRQNNRMLEAYCMSLTGRPLSEKRAGNLYFPDYRTCIYSDLNCTIVLAATYDENNLKQLPAAFLAGLAEGGGTDRFLSSRLIGCVRKLIFQRQRLLDFGTHIAGMKKAGRKELERLYEEILDFSADAQEDDMIGDAFERELYQFIKIQFAIDELKTSVMDEMKLVVDESRNKQVARFNTLSSVAVPFLLAQALFEMGILRFDSLVDLSRPWSILGWTAVGAAVAGVTIWLLRKK